jgi:hypothetical protein
VVVALPAVPGLVPAVPEVAPLPAVPPRKVAPLPATLVEPPALRSCTVYFGSTQADSSKVMVNEITLRNAND